MPDEFAALRVAYGDLADLAKSLTERDSWCATGCPGWAVRDVVFHLLGDAQRALVSLLTPSDGPADRTAVTYWIDSPGQLDPESRGLRATRTMASAWSLPYLVETYVLTSTAALALAGRTPPDTLVATQGHVLTTRDLVATFAVEAAVHHLDLVVELDRPGPGAEPLALVRQTLDGLLGRPVPVAWDDRTWALVGTGRRPLDAGEREALGADADRLPLLS